MIYGDILEFGENAQEIPSIFLRHIGVEFTDYS